MTKPCQIDGCLKLARKRGWCRMHYERWRRHGDPMWNTNELNAWIDGRGPEPGLLTARRD